MNSSFTVKTKDLKHALRQASVAASIKTSLPILGHALLEFKSQRLTIRATDLDVGAKTECSLVSSYGEWSGCVPLKRLMDSLDYCDEDCEFKCGERLELTSDATSFTIPFMPAGEFPPHPEIEGDRILFDSKWLSGALKKTTPSICKDTTRYALVGVHFSSAFIESADGRRLTRVSCPVKMTKEFILPTCGCKALASLLLEHEGNVVCVTEGKSASFQIGETLLTSKLVEAKYPNTQQVIPTESGFEFSVTSDLKQCIRAVMGYQDETHHGVKLEMTAKTLTATSQCGYGIGKSEINIASKGNPTALRIDGQFLIDAIEACSDSTATIHLIDDFSPMVVKNETTLVVIMIMRL